LAIWGGTYLLDCFRALEAPGIPVRFEYASPGGTVTFTAASYTLDLDRGILRLQRPRLTNPEGGLLASVDGVQVDLVTGRDEQKPTGWQALLFGDDEQNRGWRALLDPDRGIKTRAWGIRGQFVRLASGQFEIERYLPPPTDQEGGVPFQIGLEDVAVEFVDLMGDRPYRQAIRTQVARISGLGDDWIAGADLNAPGIGRVALALQGVAASGIHVSARARELELAPLLAHVLTTKPFKGTDYAQLRAESLKLVGPVRVFLPTEKAAKVESRLVLRAEGVRYGEYAVDRATFRGLLNEGGAQGAIDAVVDGIRGRFDGSATWAGEEIRAAGQVAANAPNPQALPLWLRRELPADVGFEDARFRGWVQYGAKGAYRVSGDARATEARYGNERIQDADVAVRARPERIVLNVRRARYGQESATGILAIDPKSRTLAGAVRAGSLDLGRLAQRFGFEGLSGNAAVVATLGGTMGKPSVSLLAQGQASYAQEAGQPMSLGDFEIDGLLRDGSLQIRRGVLRGPLGLIAANGSIGTSTDALGIGIVGRRLDPSPLFPELDGEGNLVAQVSGTLKNPKATGYVEFYNAQYGDRLIPAIRTDIVADRNRFALRGVRVTSGTAEITGDAALAFKGRRLSGNFRAQGVQLADVAPGNEDLAGGVNIPRLTLGGTLTDPQVVAEVTGEDLVVRGSKVESVTARLRGNKREVILEEAVAEANGGRLAVDGRYDLKTQGGRITGDASNLALDPLARQISDQVTLDGTVSGRASVAFDAKGIVGLEGAGLLSSVKVNGTSMGNGSWSASRTGTAYLADLRVGSIERYVELEKVRFDPADRSITGNVWMNNFLARDMIAMGDRYLDSLAPTTRQDLREVEGTINVGAQISGTADSPGLVVENLEVAGLKYRQVDFGTLTSNFKLEDRRWTLNGLNLTGPVANLSVNGFIEERGNMVLDGRITDVSLIEIGRAIPGAGAAGGKIDPFEFYVSGPTSSPRLRASLDFSGLFAPPEVQAETPNEEIEEEEEESRRIVEKDPNPPDEFGQRQLTAAERGLYGSLSNISISEADGIVIEGSYAYRGFTGALSAKAPFEYPFRIPEKGKIDARIDLEGRQLAEIANYFPALDRNRIQGTVAGTIRAEGTLDSLAYTGELNLNAPQLGFLFPEIQSGQPTGRMVPTQDSLKNLVAKVEFTGGNLGFTASGESSRGGSFTAKATTPLGQVGRLATTLREEGAQGLLTSRVDGEMTFDDLRIRQGVEGSSYVAATIAGAVQLDGTLQRPRFATANPLRLSRVETILPTFPENTGENQPPAINPRFDMRVTLADAARLRTTAAELFVLGDGRIEGSLASPDIRAQLEVDRGTLALPGGRVRLEQGGTVDVQISSSGRDTIARADVDLEGRTALTALRFGNTYERYEITLGVRGDLLSEAGLNLTASSDPPDLSRDRILALLGQTDVIEAIGTNFGSSSTERRIRDALAGYALPALADPITNKLAQGLGLDYLSLEYNPLEEASLAFAKSIGSGFFIQGRRQISDPPPGFAQQYDVRLVYRPRRFRGALSRVSFSLGADEQTPFKFAIEYGVRF
jgi:translocation and assembly module TamB